MRLFLSIFKELALGWNQQVEETEMLVKITEMSASDVYAELLLADETSSICFGSHDNSKTVVTIDGLRRPVRIDDYRWTSVQDSKWESKTNDPGPMPTIDEIVTAQVLDTTYHYGSSVRARASLTIYTRVPEWHRWNASDNFFIRIQAMEVTSLLGYGPAFTEASSLLEVLLAAKKRIRFEVGTLTDIALDQGGSGGYPRYWQKFNGTSWDFLTPTNAQDWFSAACKASEKFFADARALVGTLGLPVESLQRELVLKLANALWKETPLGKFLDEWLHIA